MPIRWVHASELEDPTPWLKGGELILTTGMGVGATPAKQRAYVKRLAEAGVAGLGFGLGFSHDKTPRALVTAAETAELPLFEVPVSGSVHRHHRSHLHEDRRRAVRHVAARGRRRARADARGHGGNGDRRASPTRSAAVVKGWVLLLDLHGLPLAATGRAASLRAERVWGELRDVATRGHLVLA